MLNSILLSATMLLLASKPIQAFNCATHTFGSCEDNIVHWYDPDDGLICDPLDCGGGRAAPKTDVPGCSNYKGTLTAAGSSYLSCFKTKGLVTGVVVTVTDTSTPAASTQFVTSTASPIVKSTASASSRQSSRSAILSSTISENIVSSFSTTIPSSTSASVSTTSPSTTSPPAISSVAVQNGTSVSSSAPSSTSSTTPNAGGKISMDSIMVVGLGLVGVMALA